MGVLGERGLLSVRLVVFPPNGGVDTVMYPLFPMPESVGCPGNPDSLQDVEAVVLSSSSVHVVSADSFPGAVGWPVTLASVPGGPPASLPGKDEYSSSQVEELSSPLSLGAAPVPVTVGIEDLVYHGEPCEGVVPVPVPPAHGAVIVPGILVVETPGDKVEDVPCPVSVPEKLLGPGPLLDGTMDPEGASTELLTPVSHEPVDVGCVELDHRPVLLCPGNVADMDLEKVLPLPVPTDQSAVSMDEPDGRAVPGAVTGLLVPFPVGKGAELGTSPVAVFETPGLVEDPPCGLVGKENDGSGSEGTSVPPCWTEPVPVGNENDVAPEPEGKPVPPCGTVPLSVGKENDVDPELDGAPVPPAGTVEFPVGNENDVPPEPDGRLVSPNCVGCGTVQAVELPGDEDAPPELEKVPVPLPSAAVPVSDPETALVLVTLPVCSPEAFVCGRVWGETSLPGSPVADLVGRPVDS